MGSHNEGDRTNALLAEQLQEALNEKGQGPFDESFYESEDKKKEVQVPIIIQRAIIKYGFKSKNEAKAYLFYELIGKIIDGY